MREGVKGGRGEEREGEDIGGREKLEEKEREEGEHGGMKDGKGGGEKMESVEEKRKCK